MISFTLQLNHFFVAYFVASSSLFVSAAKISAILASPKTKHFVDFTNKHINLLTF